MNSSTPNALNAICNTIASIRNKQNSAQRGCYRTDKALKVHKETNRQDSHHFRNELVSVAEFDSQRHRKYQWVICVRYEKYDKNQHHVEHQRKVDRKIDMHDPETAYEC